jgi:hypothetical protein
VAGAGEVDAVCGGTAVQHHGAGLYARVHGGEVDFLAVYIVPLDFWYVIPVKAFAPSKCLRFYPEDEGSLGQYEKYREAWWLMKGEEARVSGY